MGYHAPLPVTRIGTKTNARLKSYLLQETVQVANADIFTISPFYRDENDNPPGRGYDVPPKGEGKDPERAIEESKRRARNAVLDISLCNKFTHMFTWTLDPEQINRYSPEEVYTKVRAFLSNMTQRKNFRYVCIPELHKDGAIHMHGLCVLGDVTLAPSVRKNGTSRKDHAGRQVYNMDSWTWGWSTCVQLDENYERAVNYVCKYITKSESKIFGKWYLSSRSLKKKPDIIPLDSIPYEEYKEQLEESGQTPKENVVFRDVKIISIDYKKIDSVHTKKENEE